MNIKWNWGTGVVMGLGFFILMIISLVVVMFQQDISLVEKDYYPRGQAYQQMIENVQNTVPYARDITVNYTGNTIVVSFPEFFRPDATEGYVHLYHRVSDQQDRYTSLTLDSNRTFTYPANGLSGRYILKMTWQQDGIDYYTEKSITIE
jgi:hypothetical protein